ncbi:MAG: hypothetical protein P4K98_03225 [Bryobacteraceae bacterium]|nr:hypothetical protein [Bryobacteraceae bacterium]
MKKEGSLAAAALFFMAQVLSADDTRRFYQPVVETENCSNEWFLKITNYESTTCRTKPLRVSGFGIPVTGR